MSLFVMPQMAKHVDAYLAQQGVVGARAHHMLLANSSREMKRLYAENQAQRALLQRAVDALDTDDWQKKLQASIDIKKHLGEQQ